MFEKRNALECDKPYYKIQKLGFRCPWRSLIHIIYSYILQPTSVQYTLLMLIFEWVKVIKKHWAFFAQEIDTRTHNCTHNVAAPAMMTALCWSIYWAVNMLEYIIKCNATRPCHPWREPPPCCARREQLPPSPRVGNETPFIHLAGAHDWVSSRVNHRQSVRQLGTGTGSRLAG